MKDCRAWSSKYDVLAMRTEATMIRAVRSTTVAIKVSYTSYFRCHQKKKSKRFSKDPLRTGFAEIDCQGGLREAIDCGCYRFTYKLRFEQFDLQTWNLPKKGTAFSDPTKKKSFSSKWTKEGISFANVVSGEISSQTPPENENKKEDSPHGFLRQDSNSSDLAQVLNSLISSKA
ncbi:hypothetical protein TNCV_2070681 [Trichonephila clavipes]|uniref:Uncharacterized protein n=1 Tax=Trichonephila clavipes TaxID=2585209 RepID=A0A8X6W3F7_TRICX|nr:hypothetical protein TNCV_2070681 [Trichonephila clavipes]